MNQNLVSFQIEAASVDNEVVVRRQMQNDNGPVAPTGVAEAMGAALAVLRAKLDDATTDDIIYAFRRGYTGEKA